MRADTYNIITRLLYSFFAACFPSNHRGTISFIKILDELDSIGVELCAKINIRFLAQRLQLGISGTIYTIPVRVSVQYVLANDFVSISF